MYTIIQGGKVANTIVASDAFAAEIGAVLAPEGTAIGDNYSGGVFTRPVEQVDRPDLAKKIDQAVGSIYDRYTRFEPEYVKREAQALAYQAAGYAGTVPAQVAAFATPAGKTPHEAADIIIGQSSELRGALDQLGVLRMRKYEVLRAATDAAATAAYSTIIASVAAIGAAIA